MKILSVGYSDKEILDNINILYLNNKGFDLDPTYSKGCFYKKQMFIEPRFKSDLLPLYDDVINSDCRVLSFKDNELNSIIFDPPFLFRDRKSINNDKMCNRFSYFKNYNELKDMYYNSIKEFKRVLVKKGILVFKCQDMSDGLFYCTHNDIINMANSLGFKLKDIFILISKRKIIKDSNKQNVARKLHSYYLIFKNN